MVSHDFLSDGPGGAVDDKAPNDDRTRRHPLGGALAREFTSSAPMAPGTRSSDLDEYGSLDAVIPAVLDELRVLAHAQLSRRSGPVTLQTTELVHEAYLRLCGSRKVTEKGRAYFFAAASRAMRQVLIEAARRRHAAKRGGGSRALSLEAADGRVEAFSGDLLELDDALDRLAIRYPRLAKVVECRFFGGMTVEEVSSALDVSPRTVKADWAMARAWLHEELQRAMAE